LPVADTLLGDSQIAPKEDELRAFQAYQGTYDDLSPPEQFLYVMASVPRLSDKINVLILMHQFEVMHFSLLSSLLCACVQVSFLLHTPCSQGKQWRQHWHCALQGLRRDTQLSCLASEYACACDPHHGIIYLFDTTLEDFQSIDQPVCRTEVMFAKNTAVCTVAFSKTHCFTQGQLYKLYVNLFCLPLHTD